MFWLGIYPAVRIEMSEQSLQKRFFYKFRARVVGAVISALLEILIPRSLGPDRYGVFTFLQDYFLKIFAFFDVGTSTAFYQKLSQRQDEFGLITFYFRALALIYLLILLFLLATAFAGITDVFFPGQRLEHILLGFAFACSFFLLEVFIKIMDAFGYTAKSENVRAIIRTLFFVFVLVAYLSQIITLRFYFLMLAVQYLVISGIIVILLNRSARPIKGKSWRLTRASLRAYIKEFYQYSHPLVVVALVSTGFAILERLVLQRFFGNAAQGYYGFSYKISQIAFLFTSSLTPLFFREASIAFGKKQTGDIRNLLLRITPVLYLITTAIGAFIVVYADYLIILIGKAEYRDALIPLKLMACYPIHQTYGQLCGSVFFATNNNKAYRKIIVYMTLLGFLLSFFFMAPPQYFGLNLGAIGLAFKMVLIQFFSVNIQMAYLAKFLGFSFWKNVWQQISVFLSVFLICWLPKYLLGLLNLNEHLSAILSAALFAGILAVSIYLKPPLFGIQTQMVQNAIGGLKEIIKKRR